jgi:hypothetical protein
LVGHIEVELAPDDVRVVDVYAALEYWRESGVAEDTPKSAVLKLASKTAAAWFEQDADLWPSVRAMGFWNAVFEAVNDEKKDGSASSTPN